MMRIMIDKFLSEWENAYKESGISRPFYVYLRVGKLLLFIGFILEYFILFGLHFLMGVHGQRLFSSPLILAVIIGLISLLVYLWYPLYVQDLVRNDVSNNLLYTTTFMFILSKGGLSIERIMERVSETEPSEYIRKLIDKFLINIKMFGYNPQDSLNDLKQRNPCPLFNNLINGLISTVKTSGDLSGFFEYESNMLIKRREEENIELINNLGFLSEIYVTMLVIAPLLLLILLTTFSFAGQGSEASGVSSLNLVVFIGIPLLSLLMIVLIDMQVSLD